MDLKSLEDKVKKSQAVLKEALERFPGRILWIVQGTRQAVLEGPISHLNHGQ